MFQSLKGLILTHIDCFIDCFNIFVSIPQRSDFNYITRYEQGQDAIPFQSLKGLILTICLQQGKCVPSEFQSLKGLILTQFLDLWNDPELKRFNPSKV